MCESRQFIRVPDGHSWRVWRTANCYFSDVGNPNREELANFDNDERNVIHERAVTPRSHPVKD
ncbi:MAG: hypothetical protein WBQ89_07820, partial [Candidatus Acidiferrum sp.]